MFIADLPPADLAVDHSLVVVADLGGAAWHTGRASVSLLDRVVTSPADLPGASLTAPDDDTATADWGKGKPGKISWPY